MSSRPAKSTSKTFQHNWLPKKYKWKREHFTHHHTQHMAKTKTTHKEESNRPRVVWLGSQVRLYLYWYSARWFSFCSSATQVSYKVNMSDQQPPEACSTHLLQCKSWLMKCPPYCGLTNICTSPLTQLHLQLIEKEIGTKLKKSLQTLHCFWVPNTAR